MRKYISLRRAAVALSVSIASAVLAAALRLAWLAPLARAALTLVSSVVAGSLPDGCPSGAFAVDPDTLTVATAFRWWYPSVLLRRLSMVEPFRSLSRRHMCRARAAPGHCRLSQRMVSALVDASSRLPGDPVFVFDHGVHGAVLSTSLHGAMLQPPSLRRAPPRASVLAASLDGSFCVTSALGRLLHVPPPDQTRPGDARHLLAFLVAQGVDRARLQAAANLVVVNRAGKVDVYRLRTN